jgi:glycosyltransferase involved in cell wall biosynthesis
MSKVPVTVVIPTLNEEDRIGACLASVNWAAEVVVCDGGSDDRTVAVAEESGARVIVASGMTIGSQRNLGIESARFDWVLAVDGDELADVDLEKAVSRIVAEGRRVVFAIRRKNFFEDKEIRWGGWGSDYVVRVFPRTERFDTRRVHEKLASSLFVERIPSELHHFPYDRAGDFEEKLKRYSKWGAADLVDSGRKSLGLASWIRPPARVFRMLVLQLGFLDGSRGLKLAWMAARSVRRRYRLARELARTRRR